MGYTTPYQTPRHKIIATETPLKLKTKMQVDCKVLLRTTQYYSVLHSTTLYYIGLLLCTTQYYVVLQSTTLYYKILLYTTKYSFVLHNTTLYYTVLLCTIQYYLVLHS